MCEEHKHLGSEVWEDLAINPNVGVSLNEDSNSISVNFPESIDMQSKEVTWALNNIKKIFSDLMECYKN